ncbi:LacI family DNA-binding transcriptional regulator [Pengzhenrongella sicca]|uniref:LacI family DNA-binding transcriptional regulator n=1 Tax=Pengzhenrongella sicca TaxID=2819238 RepID=A0A8A4ZB85_9MICO|nr:LacI family DNA-binding transcriptional regulator [Pengzhenrongella sicca]QTE28279.1 LacI family DNA-binding transcriptional regulator [Pengzhenrongella sicca]
MTTMGDVARAAGVSVSTVSHVVNETRPVRAATRSAVLAAIDAVGYRRNSLARALATSRTRTVGLAISALSNPYFGGLVHAIEARLSAAGYSLVLADTHDDVHREAAVLGQMLERRLDGILLAPAAGAADGSLPVVLATGTPLVLIDRFAAVPCDQIAPANREPSRLLTAHLAELGHRRVAVVAGLEGLHSSVERLDGYRAAVAAAGLDDDPSLTVAGGSSQEQAHAGVRALFAGPGRPSAVVVLNNAMTIGTLRALRELGLAVPGDVALVCYDDFEWADLFSPGLTAMAQDIPRLGAGAVELLLARLATPSFAELAPRRLRVPPAFAHRDSCGCVPATLQG